MDLREREWSGVNWFHLAQDSSSCVLTDLFSIRISLEFWILQEAGDRLCGLVARVLGYRSGGPGSIPGTTKKKSSGSGTESTQPREYN
jgi:hypothetical protein